MPDHDLLFSETTTPKGDPYFNAQCRTCGFMAGGRSIAGISKAHDEHAEELREKAVRARYSQHGDEMRRALIMAAALLPMAGDGAPVRRVIALVEEAIARAEGR